MAAAVSPPTAVVGIANDALLLPLATVTLPGQLTAEELSLSWIRIPPLGAAPLKTTVPVADAPPATLEGLTERELSVTSGNTAMEAVAMPMLS